MNKLILQVLPITHFNVRETEAQTSQVTRPRPHSQHLHLLTQGDPAHYPPDIPGSPRRRAHGSRPAPRAAAGLQGSLAPALGKPSRGARSRGVETGSRGPGRVTCAAPRSPERSEAPGAGTPGSPSARPAPRGPAARRRAPATRAWRPRGRRGRQGVSLPASRLPAAPPLVAMGTRPQLAAAVQGCGGMGWAAAAEGLCREWGGAPRSSPVLADPQLRVRRVLPRRRPPGNHILGPFLFAALTSPGSATQQGSEKYLLNEGRGEAGRRSASKFLFFFFKIPFLSNLYTEGGARTHNPRDQESHALEPAILPCIQLS